MIVDTHVHVVATDEARYPLSPRPLSGEWYREAPCSAESLIEQMDACNVEGAVLVQPMGAYSFDNRYAADSAAAHPDRFVSACCIDAESERALEELDFWIAERGMQGVRLFALSQGESWLAAPGTGPLWERAQELGAHVIVTIFGHQLPELRRALERFPGLAVSLDHCAFPDPLAPDALLEMAAHENLFLKVSTHVLDAGERALGSAACFAERLVERFGADRIMWGSDFCQTHDRPYAELVETGRRAFAGLEPAQRAACLGGTARRLWPALPARRGETDDPGAALR